jgi:hypothetical protein
LIPKKSARKSEKDHLRESKRAREHRGETQADTSRERSGVEGKKERQETSLERSIGERVV